MFKACLGALALAGASVALSLSAQTITFGQDFSANPTNSGWLAYGATNLFNWNSTNQNLEVTWDSSQTNSYYYRPLGLVLDNDDDFSLSFDMQLKDASWNGYGLEIAVGLINLTNATAPDFFRGSGYQSANLAEFDYFPGYPSIDASTADSDGNLEQMYDYGTALPLMQVWHVQLSHVAGSSLLSGQVSVNGAVVSGMSTAWPNGAFGRFFVNALAVASYSDVNAFGDTMLAHGTIDNVVFNATAHPAVLQGYGMTNGVWKMTFKGRAGWTYTLERTSDFKSWTDASGAFSGAEGTLELDDAAPGAQKGFYRIRSTCVQ